MTPPAQPRAQLNPPDLRQAHEAQVRQLRIGRLAPVGAVLDAVPGAAPPR